MDIAMDPRFYEKRAISLREAACSLIWQRAAALRFQIDRPDCTSKQGK